MTVGDRIKQRREALCISQTDLAKQAKISKQTLYKYENNIITNIPHDKIASISNSLEVSPAYLMGWENPPKTNATTLADIAGNKKLMSYINKMISMEEHEIQEIYNFIDYTISKKTGV